MLTHKFNAKSSGLSSKLRLWAFLQFPIQDNINLFIIKAQQFRNSPALMCRMIIVPDQILMSLSIHHDVIVFSLAFVRTLGLEIAFSENSLVD